MDFHTAVKLGHPRPDFAAMSMLTHLQTYTPQIIDESYSYSSSPDQTSTAFVHSMDQAHTMHSGRLTPQTPESFSYVQPITVRETLNHYMNPQSWAQDGQVPIGLGFEHDFSGFAATEPDLQFWNTNLPTHTTPLTDIHNHGSMLCESPASLSVWPTTGVSLSPSQPPHTRAVPSLSISECSVQDMESPGGTQEEWPFYQDLSGNMAPTKPITTTPYLDSIKNLPMSSLDWDDGFLQRSSTF
ncbi:hypothetical protein M011DRAFT_479964 [Sporormia fimetaria CBS 119925]|uniref:Uncharacterized protein n=1 Tax=Sporormia fimetaria CBS 119925 TaxID=1340428 RepID=A0A6A6V1J1_9PLEO|nr:hypothetical protein M011DRAFT_479964 [Sporormia fimetaria CBS 119925]